MNKQKTALILINWLQGKQEWTVQKSLCNKFQKVDLLEANMPASFATRLQKIIRVWPCYLKLGLLSFLKGKNYNVIIDYTCVAGLILGIFYRLFPLSNRPKIILLKFIYIQRPNKLYDRLRYLFWRLGIASVDLIVCYSRAEAERQPKHFNCDAKKFVFVPIGVEKDKFTKFIATDAEEKYIFAAGYSNRDYGTFLSAVSGVDMPVVVIAKKYNLDSCEIPANVRVLNDVYGEEYYNTLQNAAFVVIPLADPTVSSGQEVALEAMYFGKAVIATESQGLIDYIEDGHSGVLVSPGDVDSMRKAILEFKEHPNRTCNIGATGKAVVESKFTMENFATSVADYAVALTQKL
jgi:glycosyltransferase involved in cell wall biosynthesis